MVVTITADGGVSVQDTGPGVAAGERDIVFARRRRGRDATPGGSGIRLALVARVIQAHGGSVRAKNAPGGGARFLLRPSHATQAGQDECRAGPSAGFSRSPSKAYSLRMDPCPPDLDSDRL